MTKRRRYLDAPEEDEKQEHAIQEHERRRTHRRSVRDMTM